MATVTGITLARAVDIEDAQIVSAAVVANHLILTQAGGGTIDAGDITTGLWTTTGGRATFVTRITHNGTVYASRPSGVPAGMAEYVGPTEPTTWLTGDTWVSTA
jgi:hypothetical protein